MCQQDTCGRSAREPRTIRSWSGAVQFMELLSALADGPRLRRMVESVRLDLYGVVSLTSPTKPQPYPQKASLFLSQARGGDVKVKAFWRGSRTVREHHWTLRNNLHHVLSVFCQIPNSCSWISSLERVRVRCSNLFLGHGFIKIVGGSCS